MLLNVPYCNHRFLVQFRAQGQCFIYVTPTWGVSYFLPSKASNGIVMVDWLLLLYKHSTRDKVFFCVSRNSNTHSWTCSRRFDSLLQLACLSQNEKGNWDVVGSKGFFFFFFWGVLPQNEFEISYFFLRLGMLKCHTFKLSL